MFEKLKSTFSNISKHLGETELKEKDISDTLFDLEITLLESDVGSEVVDMMRDDLKSRLLGSRVEKKSIQAVVSNTMIQTISRLFDDAGKMDLFSEIDKFKESAEPYIILFVGINGTGKTTTLAKMANLLQKSKYSVAIAAADTFRAGAIEQLKEHARRLNLKVIAQNYGSDPAAVSRDAVLYARSHKVDCVLIDSAGRMQTSKNLMEQITKINKVTKPHLKIFVGDSLAGNDTVSQAAEFHKHIEFNGSILTKADADARGGAALSIVKTTRTPVMFIGTGQEYDDLKPFDKDLFLKTVFGDLYNSMSDVPHTVRKQQAADPSGPDKPAQPAPPPEASPAAPATAAHTAPADTPADPGNNLPEQPKSRPSEPEDVMHVTPGPKPHKDPTLQKPHEVQKQTVQQRHNADSPTAPDPKSDAAPQPPEASPAAPVKRPYVPADREDPFEGISNSEIAAYADMHDVPPPESDEDAKIMAEAIRDWIRNGLPDPARTDTHDVHGNDADKTTAFHTGGVDRTPDDKIHDADAVHTDVPADASATNASQGKPKEKKGRFGFFKK